MLTYRSMKILVMDEADEMLKVNLALIPFLKSQSNVQVPNLQLPLNALLGILYFQKIGLHEMTGRIRC